MSERINNTHEPIVGTRWKIFWIIVGLLLLGHIIFCLAKHVYAPDTCHICGKEVAACNCVDAECKVCGMPEQACTCQSTIQSQLNRIAELEAAASTGNAVQYCSVCNQKESACTCATLIATLRANQSSNGNGTCKQCPVHCECEHADVRVDTYMTQALIGTANECKVNTITMRFTCLTCGEWMEDAVESLVDYEHNYGKDNVCDDCGFVKATPTVTPKPNPTQKPTSTPPAVCTHGHTYDREGTIIWSKVGTEYRCGENLQTVEKVCTSCGEVVSTTQQMVGTTDHEFNKRTCLKCGYKKPAKEASGKEEGTIESPQNEWYKEDNGEAANPVDE